MKSCSELKGAEMEGWTYSGPFDDLEPAQRPGGYTYLAQLIRDVKQNAIQAHRVILWDAVGEEEGTGIVHMAPGCGAEDFQLGKEYHMPIIAPLNEEGEFLEGFGWLSGKHVSEVAELIFDDLRRKGLALQRGALHPPLPGLLALRHRAGLPPGGRVVHQHGCQL